MEQARQLRGTFIGLPRRAQLAILGVAAVTLFVIYLVLSSAMSTRWTTVPISNMKPEKAAQAQKALEDAGIKNRMGTGATSIEVESSQVNRASAVLAEAHVAGVGAKNSCEDTFSKSGSFMSATSEQTNIQKRSCLQNEIANNIEGISGVDSASVVLVTPSTRLFTDEQQAATASVHLNTGGVALADSKVEAVRSLVTGAVENMDPDKISITDDTGRVLTAGTGGSTGSGGNRMSEATLKLTIQQMRDQEIEGKLLDKLQPIVGKGKVQVISHVELDMDSIRREVKNYGGEDNEQGPQAMVKKDTEILNKSSDTTGGPAGTPSNVTADSTDTRLAAIDTAATSGNNDYLKSGDAITYSNDEVAEAITVAPGTELRNRVSILVDRSVPADTVNGMKNAVQAYMGGDAADSFSIDRVDFTKKDQSAGAAAARRGILASYLKWLVAGLGLLAMAFLLRRQLNNRADELLFPIEDPYQLEQGSFEPIPLAELEAAVHAATTVDTQKRLELQRKVEGIARDKPADVAQQLRGWLHDDVEQYGYAPSRR